VLPHVPWTLSHSGAEYRTGAQFANGPTEAGDWGDDPVLARLGLQRHLLQVGATDELLGRLIDRLQDQGLWDDALVVVLADHGAAFDPAQPYRRPATDTVHEIYRVPLFVKQPGQATAETRYDLTYNVDVLPTIMAVLGIDERWEMNGRSILQPVTDRGPDAALYVTDAEGPDQGGALHPVIDFEQVTAIAARNADLLPRGQGWHGVVAGGPLGDLVGTPVDDLTVDDGATAVTADLEQRADFADVDTASTGALPAFVWAQVSGDLAPSDVLLVLNGRVAGALSRLGDGDTFAGVVDEDLIEQGANDVAVLVPTTDAATAFVTATLANP
jgi:hypothetical protein